MGQAKLCDRITRALNKERRGCICPAGGFDFNLAHFVGSKDSHERNQFTPRRLEPQSGQDRSKSSQLVLARRLSARDAEPDVLFKGQSYVGGGFIWTIDQILDYAADQKLKPDPSPCGNVGMKNYVAAITKGLG